MLDFLQRGLLMDEAGGADAGGGVAVADAASDFGGGVDTGTGGEDTTVHDAEFVDTGTELARVEPGTPGTVKPGERAVMNGKFTGSGRAAIESLRTLSPKLAQEVTQALLTRDWFLKEMPGGKKELATLRELAKSNGGEEGISELRFKSEQLDQIDDLFASSDPKFIDQITSDDDGKRAFAGLMGPALAKFAQIAPQHFAWHNAKNFVHLMNTGNLPTSFATQAAIMNRAAKAYSEGNHQLAASFLAEIIETHNGIVDFYNQIRGAADKQPAALGTAKDPALDDRSKQLTQREQALQKQEWETAVASQRRSIFAKTWAEQTKGRTLTPDQDSTVKGFYELRMSAKIKQWQNQAERFFANNDKTGYLREQIAFFQKAIPEAIRQAMQQGLPAKPGPKGATTTQARTATTRPSAAAPAGAIRVAKMPTTGELDAVRTTSAMLSANQAFRKDGKLVQWA